MSRRKGRILAFQALYSWDVGGEPVNELLSLSWAEADKDSGSQSPDEESGAFARILINGTINNSTEIDGLIKAHLSPSWNFDRLNKVTLAILRISVYSLLYQKDLSPSIVIDEAIDISKEYGPDDSFKFINAVLDNIKKAQTQES